MNTSNITKLVEKITFWKILILSRDDLILTEKLIKHVEYTEWKEEKVIALSNIFQEVFMQDKDLNESLSRWVLEIVEHFEKNSESHNEFIWMMEQYFYILIKRLPFYHSHGKIHWDKISKDFSIFDNESRELRKLAKEFPESISEFQGEELYEIIKSTEIDTFTWLAIKAIGLYDVWKFIKIKPQVDGNT
jgi:hypothetical protein